MCVPKDVQRPGQESSRLTMLHKRFRQPLGMDGAAEFVGEDEIPVDVGVTREVALEQLRLAMKPECLDGLGVDRDRAPRALRLRRPEADAAAGRDQLLVDPKRSSFEIESEPREAEKFPAAHPGCRRKPPEREQSIALDLLEESPELLRGQGGSATVYRRGCWPNNC
jgi:hypothetical protein